VSTADAVTREAAYLTAVDSLPTLLAPAGPWDIVQAYWSPTVGARKKRFFLVRGTIAEERFAAQRRLDTYRFTGKLYWPIGSTATGSGMWEAEQLAFDAAIDLIIARVRGLTFDKTHGGAFLSVAEAPNGSKIDVQFEDPERVAATSPAELRAVITYTADDRDFTA